MLGKMLIHGLVAAAIIGGSAAVFAQVKDNGYLTAPKPVAETVAEKTGDNGYIRPNPQAARKGDDHHRRDGHHDKRRHESHERDHDDHDD